MLKPGSLLLLLSLLVVSNWDPGREKILKNMYIVQYRQIEASDRSLDVTLMPLPCKPPSSAVPEAASAQNG